MRLLTEDAVLLCDHKLGQLRLSARQDLVTVAHRRVLVETDPEGCSIANCPVVSPVMKPCQLSLSVQAGYSDFVRVDGNRVCLDTVTGLTDGSPPGVVTYSVQSPGQDLVAGVG